MRRRIRRLQNEVTSVPVSGLGPEKAFLFTDLEGSTRLWELAPGPMSVALARHDDIMHRFIEQYGGSVFKTVGDAFCAVFPDVTAALAAALKAQIELPSESFDRIGSLRARMAIHFGSALERSGDYFGPSLNPVARLLSAGHGGQVLVSFAAAERVDELPGGATLVELGEYRLRDLTEPAEPRAPRCIHPRTFPTGPNAPRLAELLDHGSQLPMFFGLVAKRDQHA